MISVGHGARKQVGLADEGGDELGFRVVVQVVHGAQLLDLALVHQGNPVGHHEGLLLVMGDKDKGDAELGLQVLQFDLHVLAQFGIESGKGLVQQENLGTAHQGAREGDPLPLPAG